MKRTKVNYKYWELPQWYKDRIYVSDIFYSNNKRKLVLIDGENKYTINSPKREGWKDINTKRYIRVTKQMMTDKSAILILEHEE